MGCSVKKIKIMGLSMEDVIAALIENVWRKSEHAKTEYALLKSKNLNDFDPLVESNGGNDFIVPPNASVIAAYMNDEMTPYAHDGDVCWNFNQIGTVYLGVCVSKLYVYYAEFYDRIHQPEKIGIRTVEQVIEHLLLKSARNHEEPSIFEFNNCKEDQGNQICVLDSNDTPLDCVTEAAIAYPRPQLTMFGEGCQQKNPQGAVVSKLPSTTQSWSEIKNDKYQCQQGYPYSVSDTVCIGEETKLVKRTLSSKERQLFEPGVVSTLSTAAAYGALYAIAPELLGDSFRLLGLASEESAEKIKWASSLLLVGLSGSWLSAGAAMSSEYLLNKAGCSERSSRLAGQAVAVGVNLAQSFTPMGAATLCVSSLAGKFGLWAEKRVVKSMELYTAPSFNEENSDEDFACSV
jgi:hypothetical protein